MQAVPIAKELVLVGGGHSHVTVLRQLGMNPIPGLKITLLSPDTRTPYSGMLPGLVAGHYEEEDVYIDLVPLCRFAGARFIRCRIEAIDPLLQTVWTAGRPDFRYDILSIDIGITPLLDVVPGARGNVIPVKPITGFLKEWYAFVKRVAWGKPGKVGFVGSGAGGVELCLAVYHRLCQDFAPQFQGLEWHLFSDGDDILTDYPKAVRNKFRKTLEERGINIHHQYRVVCVRDHTLISMNGDQMTLDEIFWVTSASSPDWLADTGLKLNENGFICTRSTLQTQNHPNVFAVGDIAHLIDNPRPKAGVFAVRQGPVLVDNIRRLLEEKTLRKFKPQSEFLSLISTGDKYAVASRNGLNVGGGWVWRWKDWIDQRFMRRYNDLPVMQVEPGTGLLADFDQQMHCGGCGSKVNAELLTQVLDDLVPVVRDDAALFQVPQGKIMLHSVDFFRSVTDDPYELAQVAVTHALSDIYAMGGQPVTALAIVTVPYGKPPVIQSLLQQLLAGAKFQLDQDNVALVGGHTTEGAELTIGFSVNGIVDDDQVLYKSGMQQDQTIILTKALGTGTLFAADMQYKARGMWIDLALRSMKRSNQEASQILKEFHVSACTDVTGFGLAGHLQEMMDASHCGVCLDLDKLPVLKGSNYTMTELDIRSTLHAGNRQSASEVSLSDHQNYELLFDPQTSGGLLASIPSELARDCVQSLTTAGYPNAAIIGRVTGGYSLSFTQAGPFRDG